MKAHICFVALQAYNVLSGDRGARHIGGAEVQQVAIARALRDRGHRVSFVTMDHGQPDAQELDGIVVYRCYRPTAGLPGLRFVWPRLTGVWRAMGRACADVYFQRTSDAITGIVAAYCRRHAKRFIFSLGAMADCDPHLPNCTTLRERWLYRYGLQQADLVVAQTSNQQRRLKDHFGRSSKLIRSMAPDPGVFLESKDATSARLQVLWVGRFCPEKRPELIFEVAGKCPFADFEVIGSAKSELAVKAMQRLGATASNVHLRGYVRHEAMPEFYRRADLLLSTSVIEGFPNVFLEAWSYGLPLLTTFDPDDIVKEQGLGRVASAIDELAGELHALHQDPMARKALSDRVREYYLSSHHPCVVVNLYESAIADLMSLSTTSHAVSCTQQAAPPSHSS